MIYLTVAYSIIWLGTVGYCLSLAFSLKRIRQDLKALRDKIEK